VRISFCSADSMFEASLVDRFGGLDA